MTAHSTVYSGGALKPEETYARWQDEVATRQLYDISGFRRSFHFAWETLTVGDAQLARFDTVGLDYARDATRIRADGFEDVRIQLTHRGGFRGRLAEHDVVVGPGTAVLVDQTLPFFNRSADTVGRTIALPRSVFGGADVRALHGRVISGAAFTRLDDYFTWLAQAVITAPASARERVIAALGAVARATFERAAEPELQDSGALDGAAVARLRALAVDPHHSGGLAADKLARTVGVSRSALYRAAAPLGGVMEIVWSARLEAARAALSDTARPGSVSDIALAVGFADAKHFQRRFHARFGFNPSDLRPIRS